MYEIIPKLFKNHSNYSYFTYDYFLEELFFRVYSLFSEQSLTVFITKAHLNLFCSILVAQKSFHFSIENGNGQNVKYV